MDKKIRIIGEALITENPCSKKPFVGKHDFNDYEPYFFVGNNKTLSKEELVEIGKIGKDNLLMFSNGKNELYFIKRSVTKTNGRLFGSIFRIPTGTLFDWDDPMFIIEKHSSEWVIQSTKEADQYSE